VRRVFRAGASSPTRGRPVQPGVPPAARRCRSARRRRSRTLTVLHDAGELRAVLGDDGARQTCGEVVLPADRTRAPTGWGASCATSPTTRRRWPISGGEIGLAVLSPCSNAGFKRLFARRSGPDTPFWRDGQRSDSFEGGHVLPVHQARPRDTYGAARAEFEALVRGPGRRLSFPTYKPPAAEGRHRGRRARQTPPRSPRPRAFLDYAVASGRRGTPHR